MRAAPSLSPPLAGSGDPHNAFTVDLEEWFHVCGVEPLRFERWATLPSRVEPTTRWLLDVLDRADVRATFFVVGWVAERFPRLVEAVRDAGHEIGSHGHAHRRVYELDGEAFRRDLQASVRALKAAGVEDVSMFRAPEWSVNDRSLWALDVLVEEGFRLDASMAPLTMVGSRELSAASARAPDRRGADRRGAAARGRSVRTGDASRLGLGTAHELAAPGAGRDRTAEPSRPAGGAHGAPVGNRSGSAARAPACPSPLRPLLPPGRIRRPASRHSFRRLLRSHRTNRADGVGRRVILRPAALLVLTAAMSALAGSARRPAGA